MTSNDVGGLGPLFLIEVDLNTHTQNNNTLLEGNTLLNTPDDQLVVMCVDRLKASFDVHHHTFHEQHDKLSALREELYRMGKETLFDQAFAIFRGDPC